MKPRKRWLVTAAGLALLAGAGAAVYGLDPDARLRGWLRGDPWYAGRPAVAWHADLADSDANTRALATDQLGRGGAEAVPVLQAILREAETAEPRWRAADALGWIGPDARPAGPDLIAALGDPDPYVRAAAARALGRLAPEVPGAVPALVRLFPDLEAVRAVSEYGPAATEAVPALTELLDHPDPAIRRNAARALGRIGPAAEPAMPRLVAHLTDPDPAVRQYAAKGLAGIGPKAASAIEDLARMLADPDPKARQAAVETLGEWGPAAKGMLARVQERKEDPDPGVQAAARKAERLIDPSLSRGNEGRTPKRD